MKSEHLEFGRITVETKGSVFGTTEQVGLYRPPSISRR